MRYNILWIDDEHDKQNAFKSLANSEGIIIFPYKVSTDGIKELENNIDKYDCVLLDAKVFNESENEVPTTHGLMNSIFKLKELQHKRHIPFFVYTGQADLQSNAEFETMLPNIKIFKKAIHNDALFKNIKEAIDKLPETQLKINHEVIFSIFRNGYLESAVESQVLNLIRTEPPNNNSELKGILSNIRSIHESCFLKLEDIGIIPQTADSFYKKVNHLSGNKKRDPNNNKMIPTTQIYQNEYIENLNKWVYLASSGYLHNLRDNQYNDYMISNYAVESLRNGLLELLLWFKQTVELNSKTT